MDCLDYSPEVERTARMLASAAGVSWDRLQRHPGYGRNHWREQASTILRPLGVRLTIVTDCDGAWAPDA